MDDHPRLMDFAIDPELVRVALIGVEHDCFAVPDIKGSIWPKTARMVSVYVDPSINAFVARFEDDLFLPVVPGYMVPRVVVGGEEKKIVERPAEW